MSLKRENWKPWKLKKKNKYVFQEEKFLAFSSMLWVNGESASLSFQECIKEQERLIPLEQASRQKVSELKSVMDSEKSQGSVLKAILKAKESNQIEGIHGRMGDLGAIDGEFSILQAPLS